MLTISWKTIEAALSLARENPHKFKLAALCYDKKGIKLSQSQNIPTKTHPKQRLFALKASIPEKESLHAEIAALLKVRSGEPFLLIVARVKGKSLTQALAKPCPVCREAIKASSLEYVIWTTEDGIVVQRVSEWRKDQATVKPKGT